MKIPMTLSELKQAVIEIIHHDDRIRMRHLAHEYSKREEMESEYDQQGRKWNKHGHEVQ